MKKYLINIAIIMLLLFLCSLNVKAEQLKILVIGDDPRIVKLLKNAGYKLDILTSPPQVKNNADLIIEPKNGPQLGLYVDEASGPAFQIYRFLKDKKYDVIFFKERGGNGYYLTEAKRQGEAFMNTVLVGYITEPSEFTFDLSNEHQGNIDYYVRSENEKRSIEQADYVIAPSQYGFDILKAKGWKFPQDTKIIPPYLLITKQKEQIKQASQESHKINEVVFIGPCSFRYGYDIFIDTIRRARNLNPEIMAKIKVTVLDQDSSDETLGMAQNLEKSILGNESQDVIIHAKNTDYREYIKDPSRLVLFTSRKEIGDDKQIYALYEGAKFIGMKNGFLEEITQGDEALTPDINPNLLAKRLVNEIMSPSISAPKPQISLEEISNRWKIALEDIVQKTKEKPVEKSFDDPHVTVCVTHFNRPAQLKEVLEALGRQTYKNYDVIVMDDGSKREVVEQLKKETEPYMNARGWKIFYQDNLFISRARNNLVQKAKGPLIVLFEDDDTPLPDMIERFVKIRQNTNADIVNTNIAIARKDKFTIDELWIVPSAGPFISIIGDTWIGFSVVSLFSKDLYEKLGGFYDEYGFVYSDIEFYIKAIVNNAKIATSIEPTYIYNITSNDNHIISSGMRSHFYQKNIVQKAYSNAFPNEFRKLPFLTMGLQTEKRSLSAIVYSFPLYVTFALRIEEWYKEMIRYFTKEEDLKQSITIQEAN